MLSVGSKQLFKTDSITCWIVLHKLSNLVISGILMVNKIFLSSSKTRWEHSKAGSYSLLIYCFIKISKAPSGTNSAGFKPLEFLIAVLISSSASTSNGLISLIVFLNISLNMKFILAPPQSSLRLLLTYFPSLKITK